MTCRRLVAGAAALIAGIAGIALLLVVVLGSSPGIVTNGPRDRPRVALTFDADMTPAMLARLLSGSGESGYDPKVVEELRAHDAPATIFLTGLWAKTYPDVMDSLARDPLFELENHSMDHAAFETPCYGLSAVRSDEEKRREVLDAAAVMTSITGISPRYFRFPGGCHSEADLELVRGLGHEPVQWDTVSGDAFSDDADAIVRTVVSTVRPGSIVVLHLGGAPNAPATARALRRLIPELRSRGFRLVTLRSLLAD